MKWILAQAAPVTGATNAPVVYQLRPSADMVERIVDYTGLPPMVVQWGAGIAASLFVLVIGYWIANVLRRAIRRVCERKSLDVTVVGFVGNLAHALIMAFVVVTALGVVGVPTATFSAAIAAAGLAIGLALQGSLSNFAAGFLLVVLRPFKRGDTITGAGTEGVVEEISIFSTALITADNKRIMVPNSSLMNGNITNHTAHDTRRVDLPFSIGAGQDLPRAHETLLALARAEPRVLKEPAPAVANVKFIDGGIQVELRAWCKTSDWGQLGSDLINAAPLALAEAGIKGPDRTIHYRELKS